MKEKLVSIIMPAHNAEKTIEESINSVLSQSYTNWELIIVDNLSTDGTLDIINQYQAQDSRIKIILGYEKAGVSYARNQAIRQAKGSFIAFLDSDDLWLPTKLEEHIAFMLSEDLAISYTPYIVFGKVDAVVDKSSETDYQKMLYSNQMGCATVIYSVEKLGRKFYFSDVFIAEDWILWCRILKESGIASKAYPKALTKYRVEGNSLSSNKVQGAYWRYKVSRNELGLNIFQASYYLLACVYLNITKKGWTYTEAKQPELTAPEPTLLT